MTTKYDLSPWRAPQHVQPMDNRTKPHKPIGPLVPVFGGWTWTDVRGITYRTNMDGCGLFRWHSRRLDWNQVAGTFQFSLASDRRRTLRQLNRDPQYAVARIDPEARSR